MAQIIDLAYGVIDRYSAADKCSRARVIQSIYLIDWWLCLHFGIRACNVEWIYDSKRGPYSQMVMDDIEKSASGVLALEEAESIDSNVVIKICRIQNPTYSPKLTDAERESLETVVATTQEMDWSAFNSFVHSTYPLQILNRGELIDIMELAQRYKSLLYSQYRKV